MPVDAGVVDSVVAPYRQALAELQAAGTTGIEIAEMTWAVGEMERLASVLEDPAAYSAGIANLGLSQRFNDAYNRVLASWPTEDTHVHVLPEIRPPSDEELLGVVITAHMGLLERIRGTADEEVLGQALRDAIDLARSGASYPVFMRVMIERGHDLLLERQASSREQIVAALAEAEERRDPARAAYQRELLKAYDELSAHLIYGAPDPFAFELRRARIEAVHLPAIASRDALVKRWKVLLDLVAAWLDAFRADFSGEDDDRARDCNPGFLKVRERLVTETWGVTFDGIFDHETFAEERAAGRVPYSDEHLALIREARPFCTPSASPPPTLVARLEALHRGESGAAPV